MEWLEQTPNHALSVEAYQNGTLEIAGQTYDYPIILGEQVFRLPEKSVQDLQLSSFQAALDAGASLILIGTGEKQHFLAPDVQVALSQQGVGVECMNTAAACRTLSMVQAEGRRVWAWLWV